MNRAKARKRAEELVRRMTLEERASQLLNESPAIERLGIPEYNWWNEALHGVAREGVATVFPQAIGLASAFDSAKDSAIADNASETASSVDDFYGWYGSDEAENDDESKKTTFDRRYKCGPSIDELAEQLERLKAELGDRSPQLGGTNRKYAARARSNRVRIYR